MWLSLGVTLCLLSGSVFALDPQKSLTQYGHDVWQDGLPHTSILSLCQTRDGYLWFGTHEGLVRFNGTEFTVFDKRNTPEMKGNSIWSLFEDRSGRLWIGTLSGGLVCYQNRAFRAYSMRDGLAGDFVYAFCEDAAGDIWVGTKSGLSRLVNDRFESFTTYHGLSSNNILSLCADTSGDIWIGTDGGGLNRFHQGQFTKVEGLPHATVSSLWCGRNGRLWVGLYGGGFGYFEQGKFVGYTQRDGLSSNLVWTLLEDPAGTLWVGTEGGGLNRFQNGVLQVYTTRQGLSQDYARSLCVDFEGSLWIGTNAGLNRLKDGKFINYSTQEGLSNNNIRSVLEDRVGRMWIGTDGGGVNCLYKGTVTTYSTANGLSNNLVKSICEDHLGRLWFGTTGGGVDCWADGRFTAHLNTKNGLTNDVVYALAEDPLGRIWVGTYGGGVNCVQDGKVIATYSVANGLAHNVIRSVFVDRQGVVWIGTDGGGINCIKDGVLTTLSSRDGLSSDIVFSFYEDSADALWIGTNSGLNRLKDGRVTVFTTQQGLFDDKIFQILEDSDGFLWMSCNKGVFQVRRADLEQVGRGEIPLAQSVVYGKADGMRSSQCNGASQPAGWKARNGLLWFPTMAGVTVIDPRHIPINTMPPPVVIEKVLVNNEPLSLYPQRQIELAPGKENFEFYYAGLSLLVPEKVTFQYRLEGFDSDWKSADTRRVAFYTNVPPGKYRFVVRAQNNDGIWSTAPATVEFRLQPHFYQSGWAIFLMTGIVIGGVYGGTQLRLRTLHQRNERLEARIRARTLELAQTIDQLRVSEKNALELKDKALEAERKALEASATKSMFLANMSHEIRTPMNGVLGMLELLLETRLATDQQEYASIAHHSAESLLQIINDILDFSKVESGKLQLELVAFDLTRTVIESVELFARQAHQKGIELAYFIAEDVPAWVQGDPVRLRQVILNLVGNAVKFTQAGHVALRVTVESASSDTVYLRFEVTDTGIGIPTTITTHIFESFSQADGSTTRQFGGTGLGLAISKQLAELMNGQIGVESTVGKGSTFWFTAQLGLTSQSAALSPSGAEVALPQPDFSQLRVLVVEHSEIVRETCQTYLGRWGIKCDIAEEGLQALGLLRAAVKTGDPFHLLLIEKELPEMNGLAVISMVKSVPTLAAIRIFLLTPVDQILTDTELKDMGVEARIPKPVNPFHLKSLLTSTFVSVNQEEMANRKKFDATDFSLTNPPLPEQNTSKRNGLILVVEDNPVNQKLTVRLLEKRGYRVEVVENGQEAIRALQQGIYDLVFMDCQMPEMDGYEATRLIRQLESLNQLGHSKQKNSPSNGISFRIPIIALTANAMIGDREKCLAAGMDEYLSKPLKRHELDAVLLQWMRAE